MSDSSKEAVALRVAACEWAANAPIAPVDARDTIGLRIDRKLQRAAVRYGMAKKRGYTYDFTPKSEKHGRYLLDKIPADLWRRVKAKSQREGVSIRAFLLQRLTEWVEPPMR